MSHSSKYKSHSTKHNYTPTKLSKSTTNDAPKVSFLFVVNEIKCTSVNADQWGNTLPPANPQYLDVLNMQPTVFRWADGDVSPATKYAWSRGEKESCIVCCETAINDHGDPVSGWVMDEHTSYSIFSCGPHLPIIVAPGDASYGGYEVRRMCNNCDNPGGYAGRDARIWDMLHFHHPREAGQNGISQVVGGAAGRPFVAGHVPRHGSSWIPSLVPESFCNNSTESSIPESRGLAGDLAIVIGLMAFHSEEGTAENVFANKKWDKKRWLLRQEPFPFPEQEDYPRGFLVQVCLDNWEHTASSTHDILKRLEWEGGILVRD